MHKNWPILNIRPCQHNLWERSGASQSWRGCGDHQKGRKVEKVFKHKTLKILKSIHIKLLSDQGQSCHFPAKFWNERVSRFQVSLQAHQSEKQSKILLWYPSDDIETWNGLKFDCHWATIILQELRIQFNVCSKILLQIMYKPCYLVELNFEAFRSTLNMRSINDNY